MLKRPLWVFSIYWKKLGIVDEVRRKFFGLGIWWPSHLSMDHSIMSVRKNVSRWQDTTAWPKWPVSSTLHENGHENDAKSWKRKRDKRERRKKIKHHCSSLNTFYDLVLPFPHQPTHLRVLLCGSETQENYNWLGWKRDGQIEEYFEGPRRRRRKKIDFMNKFTLFSLALSNLNSYSYIL